MQIICRLVFLTCDQCSFTEIRFLRRVGVFFSTPVRSPGDEQEKVPGRQTSSMRPETVLVRIRASFWFLSYPWRRSCAGVSIHNGNVRENNLIMASATVRQLSVTGSTGVVCVQQTPLRICRCRMMNLNNAIRSYHARLFVSRSTGMPLPDMYTPGPVHVVVYYRINIAAPVCS